MNTASDSGPNPAEAETTESETAQDCLARGLLTAIEGCGPLLQRDYWAVIAAVCVGPTDLIDAIALRFAEFPPEELVKFRRADGDTERSLEVGDELDITIRMAGECKVRVVARDAQSFTLATLPGHREAGRITFGAYRNDRNDVIFHIRSRARSSNQSNYLGFLAAGDPMQTCTWSDFVAAVALTFGAGVVGRVVLETEVLSEDETDPASQVEPTFVAQGG